MAPMANLMPDDDPRPSARDNRRPSARDNRPSTDELYVYGDLARAFDRAVDNRANETRHDLTTKLLLSVCAMALVALLVFMVRLDSKQARFLARQDKILEYGMVVGKYDSEIEFLTRELVRLDAQMQTGQAWHASVKSSLGTLSALLETEEQKKAIRLIIEESTP